MTRFSAFAAFLLVAVTLGGCSGFGNDPFGWSDDRTYSTASPTQGPFPGDADQAGTKDQGTMDQPQ